MAETPPPSDLVTQEQLAYAKLLDLGMRVGFVALLVSFFLYVSGIVHPHVQVERLPELWKLPVAEYMVAADVHPGWSWLHLIGQGDFMNFIGIAFLGAVTIFCYARILPITIGNRDMMFSGMIVAEILVLGLAASGILATGH